MPLRTLFALTLALAGFLSPAGCGEWETLPAEVEPALTGAPASSRLDLYGVKLQSAKQGQPAVSLRAAKLQWQKRTLGFFSVAFLWELKVRQGAIELDLNSTECAAERASSTCGLKPAWHEIPDLFSEFGRTASRVSIEPLTLTIVDRGDPRLQLRSEIGRLRGRNELELEGAIHATSSSGQSLLAERATLREGDMLVVHGRWAFVTDRGESPSEGRGGIFRLEPSGHIAPPESEPRADGP